MLRSHEYCEICRDSKSTDPLDHRCRACGGGFHTFCYTSVYNSDEAIHRLALPSHQFTCEPCHEKLGDSFCNSCRYTFSPNEADLHKCPGCAKRVHGNCARNRHLLVDSAQGKLVSECEPGTSNPADVMYVCTDCTKRVKSRIRRHEVEGRGKMVKAVGNVANGGEELLHNKFCEVRLEVKY